MSSYYQFSQHAHPTPALPGASHNNHHGGRNRRAPRLSVSQNAQKQFRGVRSMKELNESVALSAFRNKFEVSRSFDLEDDMEFCPGLLTETDVGYTRNDDRPPQSTDLPICSWFPSTAHRSARRWRATPPNPRPRSSPSRSPRASR